MITVNNYNQEIAKVDFDKLPPALKSTHDKLMTKGASDFYGKNDNITRVIDAYLIKLNQAAEDQFVKDHVIVAPSPSSQKLVDNKTLVRGAKTLFNEFVTNVISASQLKDLKFYENIKSGKMGDTIEPLTIEKQELNLKAFGKGYKLIVEQNYIQEGDLMSDPRIDYYITDKGTMIPITYEQHGFPGTFKEYVDFEDGSITDRKGMQETIEFSKQWFKNLRDQGRSFVKGKLPNEVEKPKKLTLESKKGDLVEFTTATGHKDVGVIEIIHDDKDQGKRVFNIINKDKDPESGRHFINLNLSNAKSTDTKSASSTKSTPGTSSKRKSAAGSSGRKRNGGTKSKTKTKRTGASTKGKSSQKPKTKSRKPSKSSTKSKRTTKKTEAPKVKASRAVASAKVPVVRKIKSPELAVLTRFRNLPKQKRTVESMKRFETQISNAKKAGKYIDHKSLINLVHSKVKKIAAVKAETVDIEINEKLMARVEKAILGARERMRVSFMAGPNKDKIKVGDKVTYQPRYGSKEEKKKYSTGKLWTVTKIIKGTGNIVIERDGEVKVSTPGEGDKLVKSPFQSKKKGKSKVKRQRAESKEQRASIMGFPSEFTLDREPTPDDIKDYQVKGSPSGKLTPSQLMGYHFERLNFAGKWGDLMEHPAKNMKIMIWGPPKNGKSVGSCKFARYLSNFGKVLYNFADQGFNASTQDIIELTGLQHAKNVDITDIRTLDELENEIASGKYQFVFVDMLNSHIKRAKIKPFEFEDRFIKKYPDVSFVLVMEVTKDGKFKGDQDWMHIVDSLIEVKDFIMDCSGRYGSGSYDVWPAKHLEPMEEET